MELRVSCMGGLKLACNVFVRKTEWQERFGLHKHRWDNNIKMGVGVWMGFTWLTVEYSGSLL